MSESKSLDHIFIANAILHPQQNAVNQLVILITVMKEILPKSHRILFQGEGGILFEPDDATEYLIDNKMSKYVTNQIFEQISKMTPSRFIVYHIGYTTPAFNLAMVKCRSECEALDVLYFGISKSGAVMLTGAPEEDTNEPFTAERTCKLIQLAIDAIPGQTKDRLVSSPTYQSVNQMMNMTTVDAIEFHQTDRVRLESHVVLPILRLLRFKMYQEFTKEKRTHVDEIMDPIEIMSCVPINSLTIRDMKRICRYIKEDVDVTSRVIDFIKSKEVVKFLITHVNDPSDALLESTKVWYSNMTSGDQSWFELLEKGNPLGLAFFLDSSKESVKETHNIMSGISAISDMAPVDLKNFYLTQCAEDTNLSMVDKAVIVPLYIDSMHWRLWRKYLNTVISQNCTNDHRMFTQAYYQITIQYPFMLTNIKEVDPIVLLSLIRTSIQLTIDRKYHRGVMKLLMQIIGGRFQWNKLTSNHIMSLISEAIAMGNKFDKQMMNNLIKIYVYHYVFTWGNRANNRQRTLFQDKNDIINEIHQAINYNLQYCKFVRNMFIIHRLMSNLMKKFGGFSRFISIFDRSFGTIDLKDEVRSVMPETVDLPVFQKVLDTFETGLNLKQIIVNSIYRCIHRAKSDPAIDYRDDFTLEQLQEQLDRYRKRNEINSHDATNQSNSKSIPLNDFIEAKKIDS